MKLRDFLATGFSSKKTLIAATTIITTGALFLFWPMLWGKLIFPFRYIGHYHYIFFSAMSDMIHQWQQLPGWWPAYDSGYPAHLTLNGFLNPIFLLALYFLPPFFANNLLILLFFIINGVSFYVFAKSIKISSQGSIIGSLCYAFSGPVMIWMDVTVFIAILPVLPLAFLSCLKIMGGQTKWILFWLPLLIYAWIGGFTELTIYFLAAVTPFALYLAIKEKNGLFPWKKYLSFFGPILLSVLIVLPWLLAVAYFVSLSVRGAAQIPFTAASIAGTNISVLIHMLYPQLDVAYGDLLPFIPLGVAEDYYLYLGTLPLLLLGTIFFIKNKKTKGHLRFFIGLAAATLAVTISHSPIFWLLHQLPIIGKLRGQWKWSFVLVFSLAILAGYAFDNLKDFFDHKWRKYFIRGAWLGLLVAAAAISFISINKTYVKNEIITYGVSHYTSSERSFNRSENYYENIIAKIADSIVDNFSWTNQYLLLMAFLWLSALVYLSLSPRYWHNWRWRNLSIAITFAGSVFIWTGFLYTTPASFIKTKPQTADFLLQKEAYNSRSLPLDAEAYKTAVPYRIGFYVPDQYVAVIKEKYNIDLTANDVRQWFSYETMDLNLNNIFNIDSFHNHEPLALKRFVDIGRLIQQQAGQPKNLPAGEVKNFDDYLTAYFSKENFQLLGMLNIKYVISPFAPLGDQSDFTPVFTTTTKHGVPINIFANPYFIPRWYFANDIAWSQAEDGQKLSELTAINDFSKLTLLEGQKPLNIEPQPASNDKLKLVAYTAGKLRLETSTKNYRYLVFSENKEPFWKVAINGAAAELYTANYIYQAVLVPPGENTVEFYFPNLIDQAIMAGRAGLKSWLPN